MTYFKRFFIVWEHLLRAIMSIYYELLNISVTLYNFVFAFPVFTHLGYIIYNETVKSVTTNYTFIQEHFCAIIFFRLELHSDQMGALLVQNGNLSIATDWDKFVNGFKIIWLCKYSLAFPSTISEIISQITVKTFSLWMWCN